MKVNWKEIVKIHPLKDGKIDTDMILQSLQEDLESYIEATTVKCSVTNDDIEKAVLKVFAKNPFYTEMLTPMVRHYTVLELLPPISELQIVSKRIASWINKNHQGETINNVEERPNSLLILSKKNNADILSLRKQL